MSGELETVEYACCLQEIDNLLRADTFEKFWQIGNFYLVNCCLMASKSTQSNNRCLTVRVQCQTIHSGRGSPIRW